MDLHRWAGVIHVGSRLFWFFLMVFVARPVPGSRTRNYLPI